MTVVWWFAGLPDKLGSHGWSIGSIVRSASMASETWGSGEPKISLGSPTHCARVEYWVEPGSGSGPTSLENHAAEPFLAQGGQS